MSKEEMGSGMHHADGPAGKASVAAYDGPLRALTAARRLRRAGVLPDRVSVIGRGFVLVKDSDGNYTLEPALSAGTKEGAWVRGLFHLLPGMALRVFSREEVLVAFGPVASLLTGVAETTAARAAEVSLVALGLSGSTAGRYHSHLEAGGFLVVVHGTAQEGGGVC